MVRCGKRVLLDVVNHAALVVNQYGRLDEQIVKKLQVFLKANNLAMVALDLLAARLGLGRVREKRVGLPCGQHGNGVVVYVRADNSTRVCKCHILLAATSVLNALVANQYCAERVKQGRPMRCNNALVVVLQTRQASKAIQPVPDTDGGVPECVFQILRGTARLAHLGRCVLLCLRPVCVVYIVCQSVESADAVSDIPYLLENGFSIRQGHVHVNSIVGRS